MEADAAALERDVVTMRGAITLVASGVAVDIILCGLRRPKRPPNASGRRASGQACR
jgi:hypothetical protein